MQRGRKFRGPWVRGSARDGSEETGQVVQAVQEDRRRPLTFAPGELRALS